MDKFIEKIKILKNTIAELQKSETLTEEQIETLNKAVVSLRDYKAKKAKAKEQKFNQEIRDMGSNIQRQIDTAMREGVPEEGNFETETKKKKPHLKLVKALEEAGYRESALLLKNWGEKDNIAKAMEEELEKKHIGFKKLKGKLAHKKGVYDPAGLAAHIGRQKYGEKKMETAAAKDKKLKEKSKLKKSLFPKEKSETIPPPSIERTKEDIQRDIKYALKELKELKDCRWIIEEEAPEAKAAMEKEFARLKREIDSYIKKHSKAKK